MEPLDRPAPAPRTTLVDDRAGVERAEANRTATVRWDWSPLWIALVYAVLGILWIVWSDAAVLAIVRDQEALTRLQTYKGWFYVVASAALLFFLVRRRVNALNAALAAQQLTARERERLVTILEATTDLVCVINPDSSLRYLNAAGRRLLGIGPDAPLDRFHSSQFLAPSESGRRLDVQMLAGNAGVLELERELVRLDGSTVQVSQVLLVHKDASGGVEFISTIARDITEQRRQEGALRQAQKMEAVGRLAGGVAHDFNNLLTVILGNTSHALADAALATETRLALAEIVAASQRAAALTRQLLTFSRRQPIRLQFLDLNTATASLINMLRRLIGEDIALECRCAKEPLWLHADAGMLDQVLVNLTVNSRDAMPEGGRLLIETTQVELDATTASRHPRSRQGTFAQLSITDTGHGIAPDHLNQIFEPFFTTKPTGSGTGIGLATVHTIVEQHQGWIEVSSVVGQGTTFHVYLPIATPNTLPVLQPTPVQDAPQGRGQRILLVEDDSSLLSLTTRVLERHGYRVKAAGSSLTALSLWHQDSHRFDLLLTDLILPGGLSGFDLAQRFQQERPALRVLYCSGYSPELTRRDPLHGHRATMLEKPYLPEDLLRAVHTSLATQPTS